jgi:hypothetical protein
VQWEFPLYLFEFIAGSEVALVSYLINLLSLHDALTNLADYLEIPI